MEQPREILAEAIERAERLIVEVRGILERRELKSALPLLGMLHPVDQAHLLADIDREHQLALLEAMALGDAARVLEHMEPEQAAAVIGDMQAPILADILDQTRPDVAADILRQLPAEQSQRALQGMEEVEEVTPLLEYADESAGGIMTPEYVSTRDDMTAGNALDSVRILGPKAEDVSSILVVDKDGTLVGSLSIVRLALARPSALVSDIMDPEVLYVTSGTDQEECAKLMERYDLKYLPVVDERRRLVGMILVEEMVDVLEEEATEDMYKMTGIGGERLFGPLHGSIRRRLPWLYLNLGTTILAALVINLFQSTIAQVMALVVFLPVVAGQGGIAGTQTLTLVIRSIALGDIPERRALRILAREVLLGLIHGIFLGLVIGLLSYAWKGQWMLGVVLGTAMLGNMIVAGLAGTATPLLLRLFRIDPALGSAVIVTTITDVVGFLLFLGIAAALVSYLV